MNMHDSHCSSSSRNAAILLQFWPSRRQTAPLEYVDSQQVLCRRRSKCGSEPRDRWYFQGAPRPRQSMGTFINSVWRWTLFTIHLKTWNFSQKKLTQRELKNHIERHGTTKFRWPGWPFEVRSTEMRSPSKTIECTLKRWHSVSYKVC